MTCRHCGNEIRDDARFCPHCGTLNGSAPGSEPPQETAAYNTPAPNLEGPAGGRKKTGRLLAGAAVVVAVFALLAAAASGLFSDARKQLGRALDQTMAAYARAEKAMGLPDLNELVQTGAYSQRFSLELNGLNSNLVGYDVSALEGLGLGMNTSLNQAERKLDFALSAFWGEEDILRFFLAADDDELYFSAPDFTGETFYGVNTRTLGKDLSAMAEDSEGAAEISFNLFELMEPFLVQSGETEARLQSARAALWKDVVVKKEGSSTQSINGTQTKTTLYRVTIPHSALERYVDDVADTMTVVGVMEGYRTMLESLGVAQPEIDSLMEELDIYGELAEQVKEILEELGDLELKVGVSGGYVAVVIYEDRVRGCDVKAVLDLGGGEEYVDDLSLELEIDDTKLTWKSTGNHSGTNGEFTDRTTIRAGLYQITSKFSYQPQSGDLSWEIGMPSSMTLDMEGRLTSGKDSYDLNLEKAAVKVMGMELFSLGVKYYLGPYEGWSEPAGVRLVTEMSQAELDELDLQIQANAQAWLARTQQMFLARLPEELIGAMR
ncbi:MAG: zinc ribbon domain-containing protein [Lawsonibacter sp.]|nr:zinc ribbon domain-containing protein [Lawsonibacter sp.]